MLNRTSQYAPGSFLSKALCLLLLISLFSFRSIGQNVKNEEKKESAPVKLLYGGEWEMITEAGLKTRYLRRSDSASVAFQQEDMFMYCDEAIQFPDSNFLVALGNIKILKGDSIQLLGDTLYYYGNDRLAEMWGAITFSDSQMVLTTNQLEYDMNSNNVSYLYGGTVKDDSTILTSQRGYYNTRSKIISFGEDVVLDNPISEYHLESDTLTYNTNNKVAYFTSRTEITTREGLLIADEGEYDTQLSKSTFKKNAQIETNEYILSGDFLDYDEVLEVGEARGNVRVFSKKDTVAIYGDIGNYLGLEGRTEVFGNAMVEKNFGSGDTLYLLADTLISINDTITDTRLLLAYPQVKILSNDLQGIADSLAYNFTDSTIRFYDDPVLWSQGSQLEADTIYVKMKNNKLDKLFMNKNAFISSKDSLKNYNQIKGRDMVANFNDSKISKVDVDGNAESLYFALEADSVLIGMNRMDCSNMVMAFSDSNTLNSITSIKQVDAKFIPPHELKQDDIRLKGFNWREKEKPAKGLVWQNPSWLSIERDLGTPLIKEIPNRIREKKLVKIDSTQILFREGKYGTLISERFFSVYLRADTLTFFNPTPNIRNARGIFYVDIIPESLQDLPDSLQSRKYQTLEFAWGENQVGDDVSVNQIVLPNYQKLILRFGQYEPAKNSRKRDDLWGEAYNYYDKKR